MPGRKGGYGGYSSKTPPTKKGGTKKGGAKGGSKGGAKGGGKKGGKKK